MTTRGWPRPGTSCWSCADELGNVDTYRFDLVHVSRQVLGNLAFRFRQDVMAAYQQKDRRRVGRGRRPLPATHSRRRRVAGHAEGVVAGPVAWRRQTLGNQRCRAAALPVERPQHHYPLGTPRQSLLHEYAAKQWSGMFAGFYLPRWQMFFERLDASLAEGKPLDAAATENALRDWDVQWTHQTDCYPSAPRGDSVAVSRRLWEKYGSYFDQKSAGDDAKR